MTKKSSSYGGRFLPLESITSIRENFKQDRKVRAAGRLMSRRIMGKSVFCDLKDESAKIQLYGKQDSLGKEGFEHFSSLAIGDILGIEGVLFTSKTGEQTVRIDQFEVLSSIVRTLPEKWHGLKDVETRYRQRYVDLIVIFLSP